MCLVAAFAAGCAPSSPKEKKPETKKDAKKEDEKDPLAGQTINIGPGSGEFRGDLKQPDGTTKQETLWDVEWESSQAQPEEGGKATLRTVNGRIFTDGKPSARFKADGGRVDQKKQLLILRGNVEIVSVGDFKIKVATPNKPASSDPGDPITLTCDQVRYEAKDPKRVVIKARGKVRVQSKTGTFGPTAELWATPDLNVVATPNLFDYDEP
ncbi:MAG: hypothetical protein ACO1SV_09935 [Fimbriimonas sp.]